MRFHIVPFEERILLDAAGAAQVVDSYALEHTTDHAHNQTTQVDPPGAAQGNDDAVDGRVLVISSQVNDSFILAEAAKDNVTVITYDFNTSLSDLADSIADKLAGKEATSIGFALMGAEGQFSVTSDVYITFQNINDNVEFQSFWKTVGGMVKNGGSIDLLACNVAGNTDGVALIAQLDAFVDNTDAGHYITVNASSDKTGSTDLGGNWMLEVGNVSALDRYFDSTRIQEWSGLLDTPVMIFDVWPGTLGSTPLYYTRVGNLTFFTASTSGAGAELWVSDGTSGGTHMVKDIFSGTTGSNITGLVAMENDSTYVYFIASSTASERSVWRSDGTLAGTTQLSNINAGNDNASSLVTSYGDLSRLYFIASSPSNGTRIYEYNGSTLTAFTGHNWYINPTTLVTSYNDVYFTATGAGPAAGIGNELFSFNMSTTGSGVFVDINPGASSSSITNLFGINGTGQSMAIFSAQDATSGIEVFSWNTSLSQKWDLVTGSASSLPRDFFQNGDIVYFYAGVITQGRELCWFNVLDGGVGTATRGTFDIRSGSADSDIVLPTGVYDPTYATPYIIFSANNGTIGPELWRTNESSGTVTSVSLVSEFISGSVGGAPVSFIRGYGSRDIVSGGATWYFNANTTAGGRELWAISGTSGSAVQFDLVAGTGGSGPFNFYISGDRLFFSATNGFSGTEVWSSMINTAPIGGNKVYAASEDTPSTVTAANGVLNGATDPDGHAITAVLVTNGTKGTVVLNSNGSFTYTPNANQIGADSFTFRVRDVYGSLSPSYTATINIANVDNDPPVGLVKSYNATEDTTLTVNTTNGVVTGATDPENNTPLTALLVTTTTKGTLTLSTNGSFTFVPFANQNGSDSFTYRIKDSLNALSTLMTANITIAAVNDPPVAQNGTGGTNEDIALSGTLVGTDIDLNALTYSIVTSPTNGSINLTPSTGAYTYTPNLNYNGTDSFTFRVHDGTVNSNTSTVNITISAVNDAPVANAASGSTNEDTPLSASVSATDVDSGVLTYSVVTGPSNGSLLFNSNGTYTYTPAANYNGPDSFTFKANDGSLNSNTATVTLTINPVNDAPVANSSSVNVASNGTVNGAVSYTDIDTLPASVTASLVAGPSNGVLILNPDRTYNYTPNLNYVGSDSFTFTVNDGQFTSNVQTVSINVFLGGEPPIAYAGFDSTDEDTSLSGSVTVSDNDTPLASVTRILVSGPSDGSLTFNPDGTFLYTPNADFFGTDSFTFKANDGLFDSNVETMTITVNSINDAPVALDDTFVLNEDNAATGAVLFSDIDTIIGSLTASVVTGPANGILNFNPDGTFSYTPNGNFNGSDSFTFKVNDGFLDSATKTVTITVNAVNDAPVAVDAAASVNEDTALLGTVVGAVTDVDLDTLTFNLALGPTNGILNFNPNGSYTYTPNADFNGTDTFTFNASDGQLFSETKTITITVNPVNDDPVAQDVSATIDEDIPLADNLALSVTDVDLDTLTFSVVTGPANGTLNLNPNGTYLYTPNANFNGTDSFSYKANDGTVDSATKVVSITINSINDAPIASDVFTATDEEIPLFGSVTGSVSDVELDPLVYSLVTGTTNGLLSFNPDGTFTYTPNTNFNGVDSFTFIASDGFLDSAETTVNITINPINDAPVALDITNGTNEDTSIIGSVTGAVTDADNDPLSYNLITGPAFGIINFNPDGSYTYTPNADFNGSDSFTYNANDGTVDSATKTVTIGINPVNDAPITQNVIVTGIQNSTIEGNIPWSDIDSNSITAALVTGPAHGVLLLNSNGSFEYTPNTNYTGVDSFTFFVSDGQADSQTRQITVEVNADAQQRVATPPPVPETLPVNPIANPISPVSYPPDSSDTSISFDVPIISTDSETTIQETRDLGDRTITVITNGNIVTRPVEKTEKDHLREEKIVTQEDSVESLQTRATRDHTEMTLGTVTLDGLLLIPRDMLNAATIRGSTVWNDDNLTKLLLLIGPLVDNADFCAKQSLSNLVNSQHMARPLANRRRVRKFTLLSSLLDTLDLSFSRETRKAIAKESLKASQKTDLKSGVDISKFGEKHLQTYVKGLHKISETNFPENQFSAKEALVVELLTKYIVSQNLPNGFSFPFPLLQKNGKEKIAHYTLTKTFSLGNSEIPVYLFEAEEKNLNPILIFRGSRMNFDSISDINSIVENFNVNGPARGYYKEFIPELAMFFQEWFQQPQNQQPFRIFGYSQGGVLGQRTVVDFPEFIGRTPRDGSIFFNSPGVEKDYLDKWNALNPENRPAVINYVVTKDAVSKVGAGFIGDIYEISPKLTNKISEAHFGSKFLDDDWKSYKVHNERESESATRRILNAIQASVVTNGVYHLAQLHVALAGAKPRKFTVSPSITTPGKNFSVLRQGNNPTHIFNSYQKHPTLPVITNPTDNYSSGGHEQIFQNAQISKDEKPLLSEALSTTLALTNPPIDKPKYPKLNTSRRRLSSHDEKGSYSNLDITAAIFAVNHDLIDQLPESLESSSDKILQAVKEEEDSERWR